MAGYSTTPQARKLGLTAGLRVGLVAAPADWALQDPPELDYVAEGPVDLVLAFVRSSHELRAEQWGGRVFPGGALWIAWPRKAAGHASDVTENGIREAVLPLGLVDVKVAAIDENWSGLKVVWRREKRSSS